MLTVLFSVIRCHIKGPHVRFCSLQCITLTSEGACRGLTTARTCLVPASLRCISRMMAREVPSTFKSLLHRTPPTNTLTSTTRMTRPLRTRPPSTQTASSTWTWVGGYSCSLIHSVPPLWSNVVVFLPVGHRSISLAPNQMSGGDSQADISTSCPLSESAPPSQEREDSIDSSTLLVGPDTPVEGQAPDRASSLSTVV